MATHRHLDRTRRLPDRVRVHRQSRRRGPALTVFAVLATAVGFSGLAASPAEADPALVGSWTAPVAMTNVAEHMAVLPGSGKLLIWNSGASATVLDPTTGVETPVPVAPHIACAGMAVLPDGRILVNGGYTAASGGIGNKSTVIFDPVTESWSTGGAMTYSRWYPTTTKLPDGRIITVSGSSATRENLSQTPEVYDAGTNTWTSLPSATSPIPYYPFLYVLPDGRVIAVGATEVATSTQVLDPATMTWSVVDPAVLDAGSATMYRPGKFLKSGTSADGNTAVRPSSANTYVLEMDAPTPAFRQVASMAFPRAFHNLTTLPDGTVLATGGETTADGVNMANAVLPAEQWSPATETWTTLAGMTTGRLYHSSAVLMADGRVLVSGTGNLPGVPNNRTYEIFSPPYLHKGPRPTITSAPATTTYGATFSVATPDAANIASATLIATATVTHSTEMNSRFVPLSFTPTPDGLTMQAPANANLAPPGPYMLFIVDTNGVPSVARFVSVQSDNDGEAPVVSVTAPAGGAVLSGSVSLSASASDNVGVSGVQFFVDGVAVGGVDTAAPYSVSWDSSSVPDGAHSVTARASDAAANATTSAGVSVLVSNGGPPPSGITVDAQVFKDGKGAQTSPGLSTTGAGLLVATVSADGPSTTGGQTATVSGSGLTWTLARRSNVRPGSSEVWTAPVSGALSNVTVTSTLQRSTYTQSLTVVALKGATGVGASVATNALTGAPSGTVTTTAAGSMVLGVGNDWDGALARTLGPGQTMLHELLDPTAGTFWAQRMTATTPAAGTAVTINDTAPTIHRWNLAVVELLASATPAAPQSQPVSLFLAQAPTWRSTSSTGPFVAAIAFGPATGVNEFFCGVPTGPVAAADRFAELPRTDFVTLAASRP